MGPGVKESEASFDDTSGVDGIDEIAENIKYDTLLSYNSHESCKTADFGLLFIKG